MILRLVVSVLMLVGIASSESDFWEAMLDYYIREANVYIKGYNLDTYKIPDGVIDLPNVASNPKIYDLSSLRKLGISVNVDDKDFTVIKTAVTLDTLVFQADLHVSFFSGGLRMHLLNSTFAINLGLNFDDKGCNAQVLTVDVDFPDMNVDAWGVTQLGDDKVKDKVRDIYNAQHRDWAKTLEGKIKEYLDAILKKNPVCQPFSAFQQMGLLNEPISEKYFYFNPFSSLNTTLFSFK